MLKIDLLSDEGLNTAIYAELRERLVTGRIPPGQELSTRGLATELGVSQTPVRDAMSRLAADGAVDIRSKRRVLVPPMTSARFDDLLRCRLLLEPEAAALALPHLDASHLLRMGEIDSMLDRAIAEGDAEAYLRNNHAFHFTLYRAQPGHTMARLIETLWMQFGPFMRLVQERVGKASLEIDQHKAALTAIAAGDAQALRAAIAADIADGMGFILRAGFVGLADSPSAL